MLLGARGVDSAEGPGEDGRGMLWSCGFTYSQPWGGYWYIVHQDEPHWDLYTTVPCEETLTENIVETAVELADTLLSRIEPDKNEEG